MEIELPQVIVIRISSDWIDDPSFLEDATKTFEQFVARNKKINAVVVIWETWVELEGTQREQRIEFKTFDNAGPIYECPNIRELIKRGTRMDKSIALSFGSF